MLVDEIWHVVGDEASDIDCYVKRTVLEGIYSTTEIYMLTDSSPGLCSLLWSSNLTFFFLNLKKKRKEKMIATMLVRLDQIVGNQNNDDAKSSQYQGKQSSPARPPPPKKNRLFSLK